MKQKLFLIILSFFFLSCEKSSSVKILRLAHGLDTNHPVHLAMQRLGEVLEKESNGEMKVRIYPSGQLGAERECIELLQIGSLDITKTSAAVLENFVEDYKSLSIPYLFDSKSHSYAFYDSEAGKRLLLKGDQFRLRGLCFYDAGSRSFYMKEQPIRTPSDLEGKKIRVQKSNMAIQMISGLEGTPTPISWGELYTALQQGVVDGAENNLPSFYTSKHYEVCKYYSFDEHTTVPDVLLIGTESWNRLNKKERQWLNTAVKASVSYQREAWAKAEKTALKKIIEAGVTVNYPDKLEFRTKTEFIKQELEQNRTMKKLIDDIINLKALKTE